MRIIISAQSAASTPPASERIVINASRSSYSPLRSVCTSSSLIDLFIASNSRSASAIALPSGSLAANSKRIGRSSTRLRSPVSLFISACTRDKRLVTFWAFSVSSQRLGIPASSSRTTDCARSFGRSKTFSIETRVASMASISNPYSRAAIHEG